MGIAISAAGTPACAVACMFGMAAAGNAIGCIRRGPRGDGS
jgi:hypothetical protein